ncbi:MAG: helix-turn-helix domain-containing protein [Bacteroidota bacterium]
MRVQERTFSPREVADALGLGESTLKRWIDKGRLQSLRTAGGHRRVPFREIVRFVRSEQVEVLKPEALGLTDALGINLPGKEVPLDADHFYEVLTSGDAQRARSLLVAAYLRGASLASLCDGPVRQALHRIGKLWLDKDGTDPERDEARGIYLEHQATDLVTQAFGQIRSLMPEPKPGAPVALGGAPVGDPYLLPSQMAAAVLADIGYQVINLGANTPARSLVEAARSQEPALVWLSVSSPIPPEDLKRHVRHLAGQLPGQPQFIVGGRSRDGLAELEGDVPNLAVRDSMEALADVARDVMERETAEF